MEQGIKILLQVFSRFAQNFYGCLQSVVRGPDHSLRVQRQFRAKLVKKGHKNCLTVKRLVAMCERVFFQVFPFLPKIDKKKGKKNENRGKKNENENAHRIVRILVQEITVSSKRYLDCFPLKIDQFNGNGISG